MIREKVALQSLLGWFKWYDNQISQALRAARLGEAYSGVDSVTGRTYASVAELDAEAKIKQAEITALRGELAVLKAQTADNNIKE